MEEKKQDNKFALSANNYLLIAIGFAIVVFGFMLMSGSGSEDPKVFDDSIFNFRRLTLAPITVIIGFALVFYAIIKKPRKK